MILDAAPERVVIRISQGLQPEKTGKHSTLGVVAMNAVKFSLHNTHRYFHHTNVTVAE